MQSEAETALSLRAHHLVQEALCVNVLFEDHSFDLFGKERSNEIPKRVLRKARAFQPLHKGAPGTLTQQCRA